MASEVAWSGARAGLNLAVPQHAVRVSQENERDAERSRVEAARREGALDHVALFASLPVEERRELSATARWSPFGKGEILTHQGAEANWLYVVVSGECSVRVQVEGDEKAVARLHAGEFFGEMSLLTGAPRSATVVAATETDVTCWRLEREVFRQLIARRPELAEEVAEVIASRQEELEDVREDLSLAARAKRKDCIPMCSPASTGRSAAMRSFSEGSQGRAHPRPGRIDPVVPRARRRPALNRPRARPGQAPRDRRRHGIRFADDRIAWRAS